MKTKVLQSDQINTNRFNQVVYKNDSDVSKALQNIEWQARERLRLVKKKLLMSTKYHLHVLICATRKGDATKCLNHVLMHVWLWWRRNKVLKTQWNNSCNHVLVKRCNKVLKIKYSECVQLCAWWKKGATTCLKKKPTTICVNLMFGVNDSDTNCSKPCTVCNQVLYAKKGLLGAQNQKS